MNTDGELTGVKRLGMLAAQTLAARERHIMEVVKKWRFDTVAVHGLYSMEEALRFNQGAVIEPVVAGGATDSAGRPS